MSTTTPDTQTPGAADVKPGLHTTEFWLTVAMIAIDTGLAIADIIPGDHAVVAAGVLTILYKALRSFVKVRTASSAALVAMYRADEADSLVAHADALASMTQPSVPSAPSVVPPVPPMRTREEEEELLESRAHGMSGATCWQVLAGILWIAAALILASALFGCASTTVYRGGQKILSTQANAKSLAFQQGDTSLQVTGLDHSTPTRAGGSVIGTTGSAIAAGAAAFLTK